MIHRHPIIHHYDLRFHEYIRVLCFNVSAENSKIALIITSLFGIAVFWRLIFLFIAAIFSNKMWTKDIFDVEMSTIVLKSS